MHFLRTGFRGAPTAVAEVSGPYGGCDEGGHGGGSNALDEGAGSLGLEVVVGVAMAAVGVLLAVVLSGLDIVGEVLTVGEYGRGGGGGGISVIFECF